MALVIEDGTGVEGANSYITLAEARAYALERGVTLTADDAVLEAHLILAMDYLESLRDKYQGSKTLSTNSLQWPRYPVYIDGTLIGSNVIPQELKDAEAQLAIEQHNGIVISPSVAEKVGAVKKEKVGPLETEYFAGTGSSTGQPVMTKVDELLAPLLDARWRTGSIRTLRI